MKLPEPELMRLLAALLSLLIASQVLGGLFQRWRQPRVIGEIAGGLLFGPTVLGTLAPDAHHDLFEASSAEKQVLGFVFWLGLMLLMFCSGLETRSAVNRTEWRTTLWLTATGTVLPLLAGFWVAGAIDFSPWFGPRATPLTFALIMANALAVTSIPVIGKILFDVGLTGTSFARVVLTTAMIEDMALWVMLSVTLGLASVETASPFAIARGILVTMGYFAFCQVLGHRIYDGISRARWNPFKTAADGMPVLLVFMVTVLLAYLLGVNPIFGAFLAGRVVASSERIAAATRDQIKGFSFAFFIPAYFASVGLQLDLRHDFDLGLFGGILLGACAIKAVSVYLGARLAAQPHATGVDLAIAMNARGGPGIVLATVALNAGLITGAFQAILILLSLVTSQIAGWWLQRPSVRDALVREAYGREAPVT